MRGYSHGKEFDDADYLNKTAVNNELELLKRIASNRPFIDVGNKPALLYHANQAGLDTKIHFLEPAIDSSPNYLAVSRQRDNAHDIVRAFSKAFDQFSQSQEYQNILRRYGFKQD